jgi:Raf kinase inhibitor-like YbhB/YbcL family protein
MAALVLALVLGVLANGGGAMAFELTSSAFGRGDTIPRKHTCDGADVSPALAWKDAPSATKSFALICDDPDAPAGTWVHWVIWSVPASAGALPEGVTPTATLGDGARQGTNDFRKVGYNGPCPPRGAPHHYSFRLYALDAPLALSPGAGKAELVKAMDGHTLASAELVGRYGRQ